MQTKPCGLVNVYRELQKVLNDGSIALFVDRFDCLQMGVDINEQVCSGHKQRKTL